MIEEVRPRSATDADSIARIRSASFPIARRGFDTREVERFLDKLASWLETGGADEVRAEMIRQDFARAGARADAILRDAEEKAQRLVADAEARVDAILDQVETAPRAKPLASVTPILPSVSALSGRPLELATASARQLTALGLSRTQARRVVARRERLGGFTSVDDLDHVPGIPAQLLAEVKAGLTLGAEPLAKAA